MNRLFTPGGAGFVETGGFDQEGQAHQEIVVTVRGIDKEVKGLVRTIKAFSFIQFKPQFLILR